MDQRLLTTGRRPSTPDEEPAASGKEGILLSVTCMGQRGKLQFVPGEGLAFTPHEVGKEASAASTAHE